MYLYILSSWNKIELSKQKSVLSLINAQYYIHSINVSTITYLSLRQSPLN